MFALLFGSDVRRKIRIPLRNSPVSMLALMLVISHVEVTQLNNDKCYLISSNGAIIIQ